MNNIFTMKSWLNLRKTVWEHKFNGIDWYVFKVGVWPTVSQLIGVLLVDLIRFSEDEGSEVKIKAVEDTTGMKWEEVISIISERTT